MLFWANSPKWIFVQDIEALIIEPNQTNITPDQNESWATIDYLSHPLLKTNPDTNHKGKCVKSHKQFKQLETRLNNHTNHFPINTKNGVWTWPPTRIQIHPLTTHHFDHNKSQSSHFWPYNLRPKKNIWICLQNQQPFIIERNVDNQWRIGSEIS